MVSLWYRNVSRVIALVDLGVLLSYIAFALIWVPIVHNVIASEPDNNFFKEHLTYYLSGNSANRTGNVTKYDEGVDYSLDYLPMYIILGIGCVVAVIQVFLAVLLILATQQTPKYKSHLRKTYYWIVINAIIMVVYSIWRIVDHSLLTIIQLVVCFVSRAFGIFQVWSFSQELKQLVTTIANSTRTFPKIMRTIKIVSY